jgi:hypothetical protein
VLSSATANANIAGNEYASGSIYVTLPASCISPGVTEGATCYLCENTLFSPSYGAKRCYHRVVPAR